MFYNDGLGDRKKDDGGLGGGGGVSPVRRPAWSRVSSEVRPGGSGLYLLRS